MHIPSVYKETRLPVLHALIRAQPFATLVAARPHGLDADHLPMLLDDSHRPMGTLRGHVGRANRVWQDVGDDTEVLAIFHGPHGYVSPRWYPSRHADGRDVPTWNYVVVHARGTIAWKHDAAWLHQMLAATSGAHEGARADAWQIADPPAEYTSRLIEAIVGFEISITTISGQWKLSQGKSVAHRADVIAGLEAESGARAADLVAMMRDTD